MIEPDGGTAAPAVGADAITLDPFSFFPTRHSRLGGLGGGDGLSDPAYAFHTPYTSCAPGAVGFTVAIDGLEAAGGVLTLRVNVLPEDMRFDAKAVKIAQVPLDRLAETGGSVAIQFQAKRGMQYALLAHVHEDVEIRAASVSVTLDRRDDESTTTEDLAEAKQTIFGAAGIDNATQLFTPTPSMLAFPTSQTCTANQFAEPAYDEWTRAMGVARRRHRRQWEQVYILQSLRSYGMLQHGAHGVGFDCADDALPAVMAAAGCIVTAGHRDGADHQLLDALRRPGICPDETFDHAVDVRTLDPAAVPSDLRGYDFLWSAGAAGRLGSVAAGARFIEDSLASLNIGGVAVHTISINQSSVEAMMEAGEEVLFRQADIERLVINLISHGHEAAQIRYDRGNRPLDRVVDKPPYSDDPHVKALVGGYIATSFGLVLRRGEG